MFFGIVLPDFFSPAKETVQGQNKINKETITKKKKARYSLLLNKKRVQRSGRKIGQFQEERCPHSLLLKETCKKRGEEERSKLKGEKERTNRQETSC